MSGLFSSPQAQAQQAAAATQQYNQQNIAQVEGYTNQAATEVQNAIAAASPNPYFSAAQKMSPGTYKVDPQNTEIFGTSGPPGTSSGMPIQQPNPFFTPSSGQANPFQLSPDQRKTLPVAQRAPTGA